MEDQALTHDRCFLCGAQLSTSNRSREHIFPRWLLQRFKLWNEELTLVNGTGIRYGRFSVPCCRDCNNGPLSRLETVAKRAVQAGFEAFCDLDPVVRYQWLLKIFYTIIFRESAFSFDRKTGPKGGTIWEPEMLERLRTGHVLLQSIRFNMEVVGTPPWSILCCRTRVFNDVKQNFDFLDNIFSMGLAIRINDIGVVACLEDNNALEQSWSQSWPELHSLVLQPIQFKELAVRFFYERYLLNRVPKFIVLLPQSDTMQVVTAPLQGFSSKPIFDKGDNRVYAKMMARYTGLSFDDIFVEPDRAMSWLFEADGQLKMTWIE
jgi:hypothetical protein